MGSWERPKAIDVMQIYVGQKMGVQTRWAGAWTKLVRLSCAWLGPAQFESISIC